MSTTGVRCVGQVGLDGKGKVEWVRLFQTEWRPGPGPLYKPVWAEDDFTYTDRLHRVDAKSIVLRDGTIIPIKSAPIKHSCGEGAPVEVTVDRTVQAIRIACLGNA